MMWLTGGTQRAIALLGDGTGDNSMLFRQRSAVRSKRRTGRTPIHTLDPVFLDHRPTEFEPGKLYIVMHARWTGHLCACGCGSVIDAGLGPGYRYMIFDGSSVTIRQSIGNNHLPCRSHYFITENKIEWCEPLIARTRRIPVR